MKRSKPLARRTPVKAVNRKRRQSEFARCYHSRERVEWVKSQPCMWCKYRGRIRMCGPSENAHVKTDGMGRKAGYEFIVPLGRFHHTRYDTRIPPFDKISTRMVMEWFARDTERAWQSHLASTTETTET